MKLTVVFENNKEKELEFVFQEDEVNEIILSFLHKNGLINNKDKCKIIYFAPVDNDSLRFIEVEEYIKEKSVGDIVSTLINKIIFKLDNTTELNIIFTDYFNNNLQYVFLNSSNSSYFAEYTANYSIKPIYPICEHELRVTFKK